MSNWSVLRLNVDIFVSFSPCALESENATTTIRFNQSGLCLTSLSWLVEGLSLLLANHVASSVWKACIDLAFEGYRENPDVRGLKSDDEVYYISRL